MLFPTRRTRYKMIRTLTRWGRYTHEVLSIKSDDEIERLVDLLAHTVQVSDRGVEVLEPAE